MSSSKNLEFEKTSFLNKSNSAFIERMYLKFINKEADLPESWKDYFEYGSKVPQTREQMFFLSLWGH